jgi:TBP-interacting protein
MPKITEVPVTAWERVSAHSHIKGLGIRNGKVQKIADGLVGQIAAREAAAIVVNLVKQGRFAGRAVLMAGPMGTGKTAIALAIAKELGHDVPFVQIYGSEIYSSEVKKTEFLMRALRRAIGVRIHEMRTIYEGEVTALDIRTAPHPYNPYQRIPKGAVITLRTKDESRELKVDAEFAASLLREGVEVGDVIQIDAETGRIGIVGKSKEAEKEKVELARVKPIEIPSGNVKKEKEFVYVVTLHDLDMMKARRGGFFLLFSEKEEELTAEDRAEVDEEVKALVEAKKAEIIPGVLFIDETHMLDVEAFSFLNRALEGELAPIVIFATNRGITKIRGTDVTSAHGIPEDLLDRMLIINTKPYERDEIAEIIKIRCKEEKIEITEKAFKYLVEIGVEKSLRYAVQLLAPAKYIADQRNAKKVDEEDIKKASELFVDVKTSVQHVKEYEEEYMK